MGVATFTSDFNAAAKEMEDAAGKWLWWTAGVGLVTVALAFSFPLLFPIPNNASNIYAAQLFTSKLVTLGALFTATIWCGRMYKAAKHQAAINGHRANALKTFQALVRASSDDPTRDAVLLETTRSIFALGNTGYLDGAEGSGEGAVKILEIVKSAAGAVRT